MNEPDRPRRDVSIEEAERMPMTEEELAAIEASVCEDVLSATEVRLLKAELSAGVDDDEDEMNYDPDA